MNLEQELTPSINGGSCCALLVAGRSARGGNRVVCTRVVTCGANWEPKQIKGKVWNLKVLEIGLTRNSDWLTITNKQRGSGV